MSLISPWWKFNLTYIFVFHSLILFQMWQKTVAWCNQSRIVRRKFCLNPQKRAEKPMDSMVGLEMASLKMESIMLENIPFTMWFILAKIELCDFLKFVAFTRIVILSFIVLFGLILGKNVWLCWFLTTTNHWQLHRWLSIFYIWL